jgi:hypothetical protein
MSQKRQHDRIAAINALVRFSLSAAVQAALN